MVDKHGLLCSLYSDRGSRYFVTLEASGKVSKTTLTQIGRGLSQLGIEHIAAYSPQARGRSERVFHTLQDWLPKEFKLAGIDTVEAANKWLRDNFIADHNAWICNPGGANGISVWARSRRGFAGNTVRGGQREPAGFAWYVPGSAASSMQHLGDGGFQSFTRIRDR